MEGEIERSRPPDDHQLPPEIIFEILTRLPVKSLQSLKCVSKSWNSTISSPEFIKSHLEKSDENEELTHHRIIGQYNYPYLHLKHFPVTSLMEQPRIHSAGLDFPSARNPRSAAFVGSCKGLISIVLNSKQLYLWNPCLINAYKRLPDPGFPRNRGWLANYGLGFNALNDDYNLAQLLKIPGKDNIEARIYSLKNNSWKRIQDFPAGYPYSSWGKFLNGNLHWLAQTPSRDRNIISLDLARCEYKVIEFPSGEKDATFLMLGAFGKFLCLSCVYACTMELWIMKKYGAIDSWTKVGKIPLQESPLCISAKGEILITLKSNFGVYNPKDESVKYRKVNDPNAGYFGAHEYVESMVSPVNY